MIDIFLRIQTFVFVFQISSGYVWDFRFKMRWFGQHSLTQLLILALHWVAAVAEHEGQVACLVITASADAISHW